VARPTKNDALCGQLVDAATELIETRGLEALSAREIATACNVSPGTLYNYFENIEAIVSEVRRQLMVALEAELALAQGDEAHDVLRDRACRYEQFAGSRPQLWSLALQSAKAPGPQDLNPMTILVQTLKPALATFCTGKPQKLAADGLAAMLHALTAVATNGKHGAIIERQPEGLAAALLDTIVAGLRAQSKTGRATKQRRLKA
jgi:AcrR family transcriptional regulator